MIVLLVASVGLVLLPPFFTQGLISVAASRQLSGEGSAPRWAETAHRYMVWVALSPDSAPAR